MEREVILAVDPKRCRPWKFHNRTDGWYTRERCQDLIDSIRNKLWPLGNQVGFIPGHGPASSFGRERQSNPFVGDAVLGG